MNRQDAKNAKDEPDMFLDDLVHEVIGAVIEVHRELGPGFLENVYEEALAVELALRELPFIRQKPVGVSYKQFSVGEGRLDMLVGGCLVLELKAVDRLLPIHKAQLISYLKATGNKLGLLINFNERLVRDGIQRVVFS